MVGARAEFVEQSIAGLFFFFSFCFLRADEPCFYGQGCSKLVRMV